MPATLNPTDESYIKAVAEALFDYEPRNGERRFCEQRAEVQYRYIDKAAWVLSQATKEVR